MGKGNDPNCGAFAIAGAPLLATDGLTLIDQLAGTTGPARAQKAAELLTTGEATAALRDMPYSLIVDMDDTLITNQALFDEAQRALGDLYARLDPRGRAPQELSKLHEQMDDANITRFGFTPRRWYFSAFQAAQTYLGRKLTDEERLAVKEAAKIAMGTGQPLPGVRDALSVLAANGVRMLLKTKGAQAKQAEKLDVHRFDEYFGQRIEIVDRKDESSFRDLIGRHDLRSPVSIGDSAKSDIVPALAAGAEGILIDKTSTGVSSWAYEHADDLDVPTVASFPEAVLLLVSRQLRPA